MDDLHNAIKKQDEIQELLDSRKKNQKDEVQELLDKAENELASVRKAQMAKSKEENKIKEQLKNEKKEKEELL